MATKIAIAEIVVKKTIILIGLNFIPKISIHTTLASPLKDMYVIIYAED
ncbi:unnamed protein product [marine sediment metagenome]|uniref:Uncharacterized protein n=1 Tax=marine sediment metagenome TaxID=412755 RepID=X1HK80_9ZZZZ